jgi:glycosyltransferase involved in cell wall biosynthesis
MVQALKVGYFVKMYPRLSETFILNEILELERRGVEVVIFSLMKPDEGRFHPQVAQVKAPVFYVDASQQAGWHLLQQHWPTLASQRNRVWELFEELLVAGRPWSFELFLSAAKASAIALDFQLDHLHAHFASTPATMAYFASRITGLGFSITAHAKDIFRNTIDASLLEEKLNAARFVATVTQFNQRHILSSFPEVPPEKVKLVYNGIDLNLFSFEPQFSRQRGLILGVGRLVPKKGFPDLLAACSILKQRRVPFQCVIVGHGEQGTLLESMRQELDLADSVSLVGPKNLVEVQGYVKRASVFVLPCTTDTDGNQDALPTVLLEALASGCPVVSTSISGVPEIVTSGVDGLLVSPGDPLAVADAIEQILTAPVMAAEMGLRGLAKAEEKFDLRKNVAILEGHFRQAVSDRATQPQSRLVPAGAVNHREDTVSVI